MFSGIGRLFELLSHLSLRAEVVGAGDEPSADVDDGGDGVDLLECVLEVVHAFHCNHLLSSTSPIIGAGM